MDEIKRQISNYWARRAENFSAMRLKELAARKRLLWLAEFDGLLPDRPSKILDVGTGSGFLAFLLAPLGHSVTGIDLTPEMIDRAKRTAREFRVSADFFVMDAESPRFPAGSFDAIVTRNLTWCLPNLDRAYAAWHDLLKPDGVLINFDADYPREKKCENLPARHAHSDVSPALMSEYETIKGELRTCQRPRPDWDVDLLKDAGFREISVDFGAWERLYGERDEFFNPTPIFKITARA